MKLIFLCILSSLLGTFAYNPDHIAGTTPPYLVYLKSDYLPCTGVLIHPLWVITSAHCNLPNLRVILGISNPSDHLERDVEVSDYEKMFHHPHFSVSSITYDLMLIKLRRRIKHSNYAKAVKLPQHIVPANAMCSVSTWAYNLCDTTKDPDSLQTVNVSVISRSECRNAYKAFDITDNMICVGIVPGRRLPCKEVTSAPAVCNGVLYGILSYADGCILRADVGIYASIFHYMPWIEDTMKNN
ncbi:serine protease 58 [Arvicanthis niloticus]|uniref:serine protease 58 n=1 Tax=Arvicanthis niloticus TaxID=61156 RepID=UPI00148711F1|nr:serine protease 58 [Arvicanthis niloticus]XP_034375169.1 serine protease 58 [Arvicanthis niloticus]XP_034375170.1 serine protease 58 [Arvicanthis niloticus]